MRAARAPLFRFECQTADARFRSRHAASVRVLL